MKTLLDCGHISERGGCEVITMPDGDKFYQYDCPRHYYRNTRIYNEKETWRGPTYGRRAYGLQHGGTLTEICHHCWSAVHLDRIRTTGKGHCFVNRPAKWRAVAEVGSRYLPRKYHYNLFVKDPFEIEHGPSGTVLANTTRYWVTDHNWLWCKMLHLTFEWDGRKWYGRNVFNEFDCDCTVRILIKALKSEE